MLRRVVLCDDVEIAEWLHEHRPPDFEPAYLHAIRCDRPLWCDPSTSKEKYSELVAFLAEHDYWFRGSLLVKLSFCARAGDLDTVKWVHARYGY
ncbi:hypothetical protein PybrP1_000148 [[Pythium] brassicae (nom. inval.)]|nr:hypothetical protein PybrP1_000148 [[Pythium] brassicae (nom. inval.)]